MLKQSIQYESLVTERDFYINENEDLRRKIEEEMWNWTFSMKQQHLNQPDYDNASNTEVRFASANEASFDSLTDRLSFGNASDVAMTRSGELKDEEIDELIEDS